MITTEKEYAFTRERVADSKTPKTFVLEMRRELALWEAGIREPVPGSPVGPVSDINEDDYEALSPADRAAWNQRLVVAVKQAEIANLDRQVGILLDRIADWRRHRAWLEREISELAAIDRQPVASRT